MIEIRSFDISIGAEKPFSVYHFSDDHLCLADERDCEEKHKLAERRLNDFAGGRPERQKQIEDEIHSIIEKEAIPVVHTGDFIDFVSAANLDYAREFFSGINTVMCAGNHEFSQYVGEAWEDEAYKMQSLSQVEKAFPKGIEFGVRIINGVKFITIDDGYYYILPKHFEAFKKELEQDIPIVLVLHNPIYSADTYKKTMQNQAKTDPPYLTGCPEVLLEALSEHRRKQQHSDELTTEFVRICNSCDKIKAILAGHLHKEVIARLDNGAVQFCADGAFNGIIYKYNFI